MKPKTKQLPTPKAPARVMWASYSGMVHTVMESVWTHPVAVIPCATSKQARALVRFANMTEGERVGAMARSLKQPVSDGPFAWGMSRVKPAVVEAYARAIHDLIFKGGAK